MLHKTFPKGRAREGEGRSCRPWLLGGSVSSLPFDCYITHLLSPGRGKRRGPGCQPWPLSLLGPRQARRMGVGGWPASDKAPGCPRLPSCGLPRVVRHRGNRLLKENYSACLPTVHPLALCKASSLTVFRRRTSATSFLHHCLKPGWQPLTSSSKCSHWL